jgi:CubicO group peptidase (beta-lactamase class C family)
MKAVPASTASACPTRRPVAASPVSMGRRGGLLALAALGWGCASRVQAPDASAPPAPRGDRFDRLDQVVAGEVDAGRLPGVVTLVWHRGSVVHQRATGLRDPASRDPLAVDSIFRIYSMTKPIVSAAALILVEDGRLQLDDPVARHVPELATLKVGVEQERADGNRQLDLVEASRQPTVRDLLLHTSGITDGYFGNSLIDQAYRQAGVNTYSVSTGEWLRRLARVPLACQPGAAWEYGRSTDVLGIIVERSSGRRLDDFLAERVLGPLGMRDTGFRIAAKDHRRLAEPFPVDPGTGQPIRLRQVKQQPIFLSGAAGLVSTAADYLRFARMLMSGGEVDGRRVLTPGSVGAMLTDQLAGLRTAGARPPGPASGYGFGLGLAVRLADGGSPIAGRAGDAYWGGYGGTYFWIDRASDLAAIWMSQRPTGRVRYRALFREQVYRAIG